MKITRDEIIAARYGEDMSDEGWRMRILQRSEFDFKQSGDPLFPWHVMSLVADWGLPVPIWLIKYFDENAKRLNKIIANGSGKGTKEAELIGRALGFGASGRGGTSSGKAIRDRDRDYKIAMRVAGAIIISQERTGRPNIEAAKNDAEKFFGVSTSTVNRACDRWQAEVDQHIANVAAQRNLS